MSITNYAISGIYVYTLLAYIRDMKTKLENSIREKSAVALNEAITGAAPTIKAGEIAKKSMIALSYLNELKSGKKRIGIVHLCKVAFTLNKYPSELLPIEWQKPAEIDPEKLKLVIEWIMDVQNQPGAKLSPEVFSKLISFGYGKIMKNPNLTKELFHDSIEVLLVDVKIK